MSGKTNLKLLTILHSLSHEKSMLCPTLLIRGRIEIEESSSHFIYLGLVKETIAVGTAIADRPPHRSVRAALPHTALTLDVTSTPHVNTCRGTYVQSSARPGDPALCPVQ